jgi:hypothetical protein
MAATRKDLLSMKFAPHSIVPDSKEITVAIFDVRIPGTAARLHRERAAWAENGDIEALDQNHYILIVQPGGALGVPGGAASLTGTGRWTM